jgi:glucosyl-3-phosphoglycerate phosphatase
MYPSSIDSSASHAFNHLVELYENENVQRPHLLQHDYFALRHGQSEANVAGIIASDPNVACQKYGLSDTGRMQARKAGQEVLQQFLRGGYHSLVLLSSDLLRAYDTACVVQDVIRQYNDNNANMTHNGVPMYQNQVVREVRLRERGFGDWDGTTDENYARVWQDDAANANHTNGNVESVHSVMGRVTRCVRDWDATLEKIDDKKRMVVLVAHGDVLQILQTAFAQWPGTQHRQIAHLETATLRPLNFGASF